MKQPQDSVLIKTKAVFSWLLLLQLQGYYQFKGSRVCSNIFHPSAILEFHYIMEGAKYPSLMISFVRSRLGSLVGMVASASAFLGKIILVKHVLASLPQAPVGGGFILIFIFGINASAFPSQCTQLPKASKAGHGYDPTQAP